MVDINFIGHPYTWSNNRRGLDRILEILDRGIANSQWVTANPNYSIFHLPRIASDHYPILLKPHVHTQKMSKPFKYENTCNLHHGFRDMVKEKWTRMSVTPGTIHFKLRALADHLQRWNRNTFGHVIKETGRLRKRIARIQKHPNYNKSNFPQNLEFSLVKEYNERLMQEEVFWPQRSLVNGLKCGDKNTKFFHTTALLHSESNAIHTLQDEQGNSFSNLEDMLGAAADYFSNIFTAPTVVEKKCISACLLRIISPEENQRLFNALEEEEVKKALFAITKNKAPGPDGYNAIFFQEFWEEKKGI